MNIKELKEELDKYPDYVDILVIDRERGDYAYSKIRNIVNMGHNRISIEINYDLDRYGN